MLRRQLISYIVPGAPATRRLARGDEALLRPEVGFTPKWYREALGIDFGQRWHVDVRYALLIGTGVCLGAYSRTLRKCGETALIWLTSSPDDKFDPEVLSRSEKELELIESIRKGVQPRVTRA